MRPQDYDLDGLQIVEDAAGAARAVMNPGVSKHSPWADLPRATRNFWREYARRLLAGMVGTMLWKEART